MNFYIEVKDGTPINHPASENNIIEVFGTIPEQWESFIRVEKTIPDTYQVVSDTSTYQKINNVWTDVWHVRDMTPEEKTAKQELEIQIDSSMGIVVSS